MSINFFKSDCQKTTSEKKFGLYDPEDNSPVEIKLIEEDTWNATVINKFDKSVLFSAIDNCIEVIKDNGETDVRCDCMLTYDATLLLIELKNKRGSWQAEGLRQIENIALRMLHENPEYINKFKKRRAIVANRKNRFPSFHESNVEQRQYFSSVLKMRIQFEAVIHID